MEKQLFEELNPSEKNILQIALWGDVDMRRYAPEIRDICRKLGLIEPHWLGEEIKKRAGQQGEDADPLF